MRASILSLGLAALSPGCFTYPCDRDVLACEEGEPLAIDRTCKQENGELVLELGEGEGEFSALAADAWPQVHHGPQGGIHFMIGVRLTGVDPEHESFEIEVAKPADPSGGEIPEDPYVLSEELAASLTNIGSCLPDPAAPRNVEEMRRMDALFEGIDSFDELPQTLAQTDLVSLDAIVRERP